MRTNEDFVKALSINVPDDRNFSTTQPEGLRNNCEAVEVLNVLNILLLKSSLWEDSNPAI